MIDGAAESGSLTRCGWALGDPLLLEYHDREWGVPLHDDRGLFEFLILEGAQAGLSWLTILRRREGYRAAFRGFDPAAVASFTQEDVDTLVVSTVIIRNRAKIEAAVRNARAFLGVVEEHGSFDRYIWRFTDGQVIRNAWQSMDRVPAETAESRAMSKDLRRWGFSFVGPTICYAFMQATGMVNDHVVSCFRHGEIERDDHPHRQS